MWEGVIYDPTGVIDHAPFDIVVTFEEVSGDLTGTLDVLGVIECIPITSISISESRPLATEPTGDVRIFPTPHWTRYSALVGWGNAHIHFSFIFDPAGQVIGLDIVPDWPVPPDPAAGLPIETVFWLPFNGAWWVNDVPDNIPGEVNTASPGERDRAADGRARVPADGPFPGG